MGTTALDRIDAPRPAPPDRWYNVIPDLPKAPDPLLDPKTRSPVTSEYMERLLTRIAIAQEASLERWIEIPGPVAHAYRLWRPTPLYRALALEQHLSTPAEIYFKYEASSPSGSHKLNSALPQTYFASLERVGRLVTDTGAGQWGSALALAGRLFEVETTVYMVRASLDQKPYRRLLMESLGAEVLPSPSATTECGRRVLDLDPNHPGSEAIAVGEAIETVHQDPAAKLAIGGFGNHVLLHQTVIGLEAREQLLVADRQPDFLIASCGCGSNLAGLAFPWVADKLQGSPVTILGAEPSDCPTLSEGTYRYDYADAFGVGPLTRTYTLGHDFLPAAIHAGGLRYHGVAPLIGALRALGVIESRAFTQEEALSAGLLFTRLHGLVPAPETAYAIRAAIEVARQSKLADKRDVILFCFSGAGQFDLEAYTSLEAPSASRSSFDHPMASRASR